MLRACGLLSPENLMVIKESFSQLVRYGAVGVVNTLLTFFSFLLLRRAGAGLDISNLVSFVLGMLCSFLLNKFWTFRAGRRNMLREAFLFFGGSALCWGVQWVAFRCALIVLPELVAQIAGMAVYTILGFLFNKLVTFRRNN